MKLIMENWEEFLSEDFSKIESMVDRLGDRAVSIERSRNGVITVSFVDASGGLPVGGAPHPVGLLNMHKAKSDEGNCLNAWVISYSLADKGYGPLLYDVAIEMASMDPKASGLTPDRTNLSADAFGVWKKYLTIRPDVEKSQLDDLENSLTPDDKDNCDPDSATVHAPFPSLLSLFGEEDEEKYNKNFTKYLKGSAVMKVYSKRSAPAIKKLISLGKLFMNGRKVER